MWLLPMRTVHYLNNSVTGFAAAPGHATGAFVDMCSRHCNNEPVIEGYSSLMAFAEWFEGFASIGSMADADSSGSGARRLWVQQTAVPFSPKAPYCRSCCH